MTNKKTNQSKNEKGKQEQSGSKTTTTSIGTHMSQASKNAQKGKSRSSDQSIKNKRSISSAIEAQDE